MQPQTLTLRISHSIHLLHLIHEETLWILLAINRDLTPQKLYDLLILWLRLQLKDRAHFAIRTLGAANKTALALTFTECAILVFTNAPVCSAAFGRCYAAGGNLFNDDFGSGCVGGVVRVGLDELLYVEGYSSVADGCAG